MNSCVSVINVIPLQDYKLLLTFDSQEKKIFDVSPLFHKGKFSELQNKNLFQSVHLSFDTVAWSNGMDIDPEFLYAHSFS